MKARTFAEMALGIALVLLAPRLGGWFARRGAGPGTEADPGVETPTTSPPA